MNSWYIGQTIVCINAGIINKHIPTEVKKHLKVGNTYVIREILDYEYLSDNSTEVQLAFRLVGIVCEERWNSAMGRKAPEYAFFEGRFKPLEENEEKIDIGETLRDCLNQVNKKAVTFDDDFEREWRKEERVPQKEKETIK